MRIRVIGVGTPNGDDAAGLVVAERLAAHVHSPGVEVVRCAHPLDLVHLLAAADVVVVVDALRSGAEPGSLHCVRPEDLSRVSELSTHALGVAEALALAAALDCMPARLEIVGIEVDPIEQPRFGKVEPPDASADEAWSSGPSALSGAAARGAERAIEHVLERIGTWTSPTQRPLTASTPRASDASLAEG